MKYWYCDAGNDGEYLDLVLSDVHFGIASNEQDNITSFALYKAGIGRYAYNPFSILFIIII